jgi:hypothetical protein
LKKGFSRKGAKAQSLPGSQYGSLRLPLRLAPLREKPFFNPLDDSGLAAYSLLRVMSQSLYRYYYYYGPLSTGRDGQAMGCRRAVT